jgi:hypothetical protein
MQRPYDWISHDPDFSYLKSPGKFESFLKTQEGKDYPTTIHDTTNAGGKDHDVGRDASRSSHDAVAAGERR